MSNAPTIETGRHIEDMTAAELAKSFVCRGNGTCQRTTKKVLVAAGRRIPLCGIHTRALSVSNGSVRG
jgi:hypothetical protein